MTSGLSGSTVCTPQDAALKNLATQTVSNVAPSRSENKSPVAIVISDFCTTGGMDMANYALADYLARQHRPLHLVAHHVDDELARRESVTVHRAPRPLKSNLLGMPFIDRLGRRVARKVQRQGGRVIVNGGNCAWGDVNWVHYVHAAFFAQSAASLIWRVKNRLAFAASARDERRSLRMARVVIANSHRTRNDLITRLGVEPDRIHVVYYGNNPVFVPRTDSERTTIREKFGWAADRPIVTFIGALGDRRKGFDTLFTAWKKLCESTAWDADLVVVGYGVEMPVWKQRAADAGLESRFHFLGFRRDVPEILAASDALVAPTRYEAYGLGVQEALCTALPAIVSAGAGIAERYPTELSELLIPDPEDASDLAARLHRWREQPRRFRSQFEQLSSTLRAHSWDDMAAEILQKTLES